MVPCVIFGFLQGEIIQKIYKLLKISIKGDYMEQESDDYFFERV